MLVCITPLTDVNKLLSLYHYARETSVLLEVGYFTEALREAYIDKFALTANTFSLAETGYTLSELVTFRE